VWENANLDFIYPGMPCKYVFLDDFKVQELKGTVVHAHAITALQGNALDGRTYRTKAVLTLLVEQKSKIRKLVKRPVSGVF
jgi:hypothetical protein